MPVVIGAGVGLSALAVGRVLHSDLAACAVDGLVAATALAGLILRDRRELKQLRGGSWDGPVAPSPVAADPPGVLLNSA